ncbi:hypothetical protein GCM10022381_40200 [Leifsonia kafniensis]|uniref:DUF2207 domain-containing protein n=1 Tax=Leifsonia kafniensis TaxID=475957 RepID=A0ABP7L640_9MICO
MRRLLRLVVTTSCAALALAAFAVAAPATAAPSQAPMIVATDTSDFTFDSWHSDLRLGLTADGHSELLTTETIVARFPDFDQNHGIRRAIPTDYRGHPTGLEIESVTDENGVPRSYDTESTSDDSGDFLELTIAADDFVHGANTYRITYRQSNVTFIPSGSNDDQFFWEVNGTGWDQPFGDVSATLLIDPAIAGKLTGQVRCLQGAADSGSDCASLTSEADGDGWRIEAATGPLAAHQGLALVVGFEPATFVPRDDSFLASPAPSIGLAGALIALAGLALGWIGRAGPWRNARGRPTIIAEYLPPKGVSLLSSANVSATATKLIPALILSFAVRGNLRVLAENGKKKYTLELVHADGLEPSEHAILADLFPGLQPGTLRKLAKKDAKLAAALQKKLAAVPQRAVADGLRLKIGGPLRRWAIILGIVALPLSFFGSVIALSDQIGGVWPVLTLIVGIVAAIGALVLASVVRPLTAAGAELRDYLAGLRLYIKLAEADRMRVLQSPQGALRSPYRPDAATEATFDPSADPSVDPAQQLEVLRLSERLLPYAALFGLEKEWSAVLGDYYARSGAEPDWYLGSSAFNAAYFGAAIASFSASTATSWAGTASSSGGSGFSGGASVGGGGGGGGGGGV